MYVVDQVTLERGLRGRFMEAFNNGEDPAEIAPFILQTESDGADEKYGWLGQSPNLSEWVDERIVKGLLSFDYTIPNKDYEATIGVDRNSLKDDRMGAVNIRIDDLARKARIHPRELFINALVNGTTDLAYDGLAFFSASHTEGDSGTQTNLYSGTGTSLAQLKTDIEGATSQMKSLKDDRGQPFDEGAFQIGIVCPVGLEWVFDELNTSTQISSSTNNMKGKIKKLVVSSRFSDADDWYLANVAPGIAPIIQQNRQAPMFEALEGNSTAGFMKKKFHYGIDYRVGFGYGLWQRMVKVTN